VHRAHGTVRRRPILHRRRIAVEEQEDAGRQAVAVLLLAERSQPEHFPIEAPRFLLVLGRAVDDRLEDAGKLHAQSSSSALEPG
jgi:hypothetical protein